MYLFILMIIINYLYYSTSNIAQACVLILIWKSIVLVVEYGFPSL